MSTTTTTTTTPGSLAVPSGQVEQTLLLDSDIRDWVVLPLLVIMITAGLLRHFMGVVMKAAPKFIPKVEQRSKSLLQKSMQLRGGPANYLSTQKWEARRQYYSDKHDGHLRAQADWAEEEEAANPSTGGVDPMNPAMMMEGMKGQMAFMVQNMVMMQGISHFFKGFILLRVPFPLTRGFKSMFQRGIAEQMSTLDTSYVSSVSWYFLVMYGLRGFFRMAIGHPAQEQVESNQILQKLGMHHAPPTAKFDAPKKLKSEADNLELISRNKKSELDSVEKRLLGKKYPKKKLQANKNDLYGYGTVVSSKSTKSKKRN